MKDEDIKELREIVERNPGILERVSLLKRRIAEEMLKDKEVLDKPKKDGKQRNATAAPFT